MVHERFKSIHRTQLGTTQYFLSCEEGAWRHATLLVWWTLTTSLRRPSTGSSRLCSKVRVTRAVSGRFREWERLESKELTFTSFLVRLEKVKFYKKTRTSSDSHVFPEDWTLSTRSQLGPYPMAIRSCRTRRPVSTESGFVHEQRSIRET